MSGIEEKVKMRNAEVQIDGKSITEMFTEQVKIEDVKKWDDQLKLEIVYWGEYDIGVNTVSRKYVKQNWESILTKNHAGKEYVDNLYYIDKGTADGKENNVSKHVIYITPLTQINKGETVKVSIKASTNDPYEKEISCEITLKVKEQTTNSYKIVDVPNRNYAVLEIVNAQNTALQYTLTFDPRVLRIDTNDEVCVNRVSGTTTTIDGVQYLNKVVFNMNKESAKNIKFYKVDMTKDYTYPSGETTSVINVST